MTTEAVDFLTSADNNWDVISGSHRPHNSRKQHFMISHPETGFHVVCNHTITEKGGESPRHHHNFEEIRYLLEGYGYYGKTKIGPGTVMYVPESVYYGPQVVEGTRGLNFQFPGPSGVPRFSNDEVKKGREEIRSLGVTFENGAAHWPSGKKQDSYEAIWEHLAGRPIEYAPPRYEEPVYMYTQRFPWRSTVHTGVTVKHLGYFNECGPNITLLHLEPGTSTPCGTVGCVEMRLVLEGEVEYGGKTGTAISRLYFPPGVLYEEMASRSGATILVFQVGVPGGEAPPLKVL